MHKADLAATLKALGDSYAARLPEKMAQLEQQWRQLSGDNGEGFETLHRMVHSLTGSGKTFGFPALSEAAYELEAALNEIIAAKAAPDSEQAAQIERLLAELQRVANNAAQRLSG